MYPKPLFLVREDRIDPLRFSPFLICANYTEIVKYKCNVIRKEEHGAQKPHSYRHCAKRIQYRPQDLARRNLHQAFQRGRQEQRACRRQSP